MRELSSIKKLQILDFDTELDWFTREEKVQDFDSSEQNPNSQFSIDSVSTNTSLRALDTQILFALR